MNSTVFVRPNLKVFIFGGILLLVIQHLITNVHSQATQGKPLILNAREVTDGDLRELIERANQAPSTQLYLRISHYLEKKGVYRRALLFMRRAEKLAQIEGLEAD
jgi:hypothetical protein